MNPYKFNSNSNSNSQWYLRNLIAKALNIELNEVYKIVKTINNNIIELHSGEKYKLTLEKIEE